MDDPKGSALKQPPPTKVKLDLTLEEIFSGCTRKEKIYRRVLDKYEIVEKMEEKILDVLIKPGTLAGTRITIMNQGDIHHNKIPANVVFIVGEKLHKIFIRSKFDLIYTATITSEDAILGCDLQIPTLNSDVSIPLFLNEQVNEKTEKRITGHGFPIPDNPKRRGDIIVNFRIVNFQSNIENSPGKVQLPPNKFNLVLTLKEIFHGCVKREKIEIKIIDKKGNKRTEGKILKVQVKPGSIKGSKITYPYSGNMSYGKISADVVFIVIEKEHPIFKTIDHDLIYLAKITTKEAIIGGELIIPTFEQKQFKHVFNGGITPESEQRIPKMGLLNSEKNAWGDLIIKFQILFCDDSKTVEPNQLREKLPPNKFVVKLTLEELFHGCKKYQKISIKIIDQIGSESEEEKILKIKIIPGSFDNIIFPSEGDRAYGKISADVIFSISEEPHVFFERNGHNLQYKADISAKEAILGCDLLIPTLEGDQINLNLTKSTSPSTVMSIPGRGFPIPNTNDQRGDINVLFDIIFDNEHLEPVEHDLLISLEEILNGCKKEFKIKRKIINSDGVEQMEKKKFKIDIKPGTRTGSRIIFPYEGDQFIGKNPADVVFVVRDKPHALFARNDADLEFIVTLTKFELIYDSITIPTLGNGPKKTITLDRIPDKGEVRTFANCGLPFEDNPKIRGKLVVSFNIIENL